MAQARDTQGRFVGASELAKFVREVDIFSSKLVPAEVRRFTANTALAVLNGVVMTTRVKTGRARGNWQLGIGSNPSGETGRTDKEGAATLLDGAAKLKTLLPFVPVFITNNVPYILILNDKLGDKMIERTLAQVRVAFA